MSDQPKPVRILLGERASQALSDAGDDLFVVVGRGTTDDPPGRWVIHLIPCKIREADRFIAKIANRQPKS